MDTSRNSSVIPACGGFVGEPADVFDAVSTHDLRKMGIPGAWACFGAVSPYTAQRPKKKIVATGSSGSYNFFGPEMAIDLRVPAKALKMMDPDGKTMGKPYGQEWNISGKYVGYG